MKKRVISLILVVCMAVSFSTIPAYASDYNYTYYKQSGWKNNNGITLPSMCYLTSIAMLVSDLGKKVTPLDVYYANGGVVKCYWGTICNYYGLTYGEVALKTYSDETAKRQAIADALTSGKYPAGVLVVGYTNSVYHMVVARRVVNGVIYCDDPANGSNIPISDTRRVSENIVCYWTLTPNSKWNSSGTGGTGSASQTAAISMSSIESGGWSVTIPANYKLLLYADNTSTSSATYVSAKSSSYEIRCSQKATLSNGAIRYYAAFNTSEHYWFTYSNGMSVQSNSSTKIHTINFSANGGNVSPSYKQVTAGATYGDLPTPTRDGYTFDGWYTAASGGEQVTASTTVNLSSDQITLYAHWSGTSTAFLVTLNANGGTVPTHTILVEQGGTYGELPQPTPENSNYSFAGWYTAADGGTKIESSSRLTANADHTLYAHWINVREAVLDPNGGTVSGSSSPIRVEYKNGGNLPAAVRQGYTFDGWYTEKSGGEKIQSGWKRFNEGAYFYAHWTPIASGSYIVTFDSCGGEFSSGSASIEVQAGGTYGKLPWCWGPTFGAKMIGWYTSPTGGTRVMDNDPLVINGDHTLYARYEKQLYTITLDPNGGTVARQISGTMSSYPQDYTVGASTQTYEGIPNAVWEGHEFLGWYTAPTGGTRVTSDSSLVIRDDHTLYAHWK